MTLTEVQLAKITAKIDSLRKEAKQLESQAYSTDSRFLHAWSSEFAGPPASIALNTNKAKELRGQAEFLEKVKRGETSLKTLAFLEQNILLVDKQIEALTGFKNTMREEISLVKYLEEVIS